MGDTKPPPDSSAIALHFDAAMLQTIAWLPDGRCVCTSDGAPIVAVDPDSGEKTVIVERPPRYTQALRRMPDSIHLLVQDGSELRLLNIEDGSFLRTIGTLKNLVKAAIDARGDAILLTDEEKASMGV